MGDFSLSIKANGEVWSWGYNLYGQLGDNTAGIAASKSSPVLVVGSHIFADIDYLQDPTALVRWGKPEGDWIPWDDGLQGYPWTLSEGARIFPNGDGFGRIGFDEQATGAFAISKVLDTGRATNIITIIDTENPGGYAIQIRGSDEPF